MIKAHARWPLLKNYCSRVRLIGGFPYWAVVNDFILMEREQVSIDLFCYSMYDLWWTFLKFRFYFRLFLSEDGFFFCSFWVYLEYSFQVVCFVCINLDYGWSEEYLGKFAWNKWKSLIVFRLEYIKYFYTNRTSMARAMFSMKDKYIICCENVVRYIKINIAI